MGWMTRKLISVATITLDIKHYMEEGTEQIDIDQTPTGGIKGDHRESDPRLEVSARQLWLRKMY